MRQGQQNRRGRGRNNRKSQNPLTRSFESNGPDVKIRGTPSHIAEKYISLARDAHSSGDPVLAESYLQHAEHYNRIIMAFREQQIQQGGDPGQLRRPQGLNDFEGDDFDDEGEEGTADFGGAIMGPNEPQPSLRNFEPQRHEGQREGREGREGQRHEHRGRGDFQFRQNRDRNQDRNQNGMRHGDRGQHQEGHGSRGDHQRGEPREGRHGGNGRHERHDMNRHDAPRAEMAREIPRQEPARAEPVPEPAGRPEVASRPEGGRVEGGSRRGGGEGRARREFSGSVGGDQPEFLRRSVRRPRREEAAEAGEAPQPTAAIVDDNAE